MKRNKTMKIRAIGQSMVRSSGASSGYPPYLHFCIPPNDLI